jgi:hypothetical protein
LLTAGVTFEVFPVKMVGGGPLLRATALVEGELVDLDSEWFCNSAAWLNDPLLSDGPVIGVVVVSSLTTIAAPDVPANEFGETLLIGKKDDGLRGGVVVSSSR